eukprot:CAMPEP_0113685530 /NCGR_PEP_ID=MMETSP0038_2-20120614/14726_1 /TAXON_ID=2898 /ORGANISM="Cryptomonas paramecium" /LENGTH=515 /DNA_ID=CAMNT_0000605633 /DNA_START=103 /DNA_END=1646 /DNA_ORIENTATION=+ /assembly_acc=CAM_ASM_000170
MSEQDPAAPRKRSRWGEAVTQEVEQPANGSHAASNEATDSAAAKRPRKSKWDNVQPADIGYANNNDPSRISKDALAKAQRMAAIQAQIAQQIKSLSTGPAEALTFPGMIGPQVLSNLIRRETFKPAPLILDEKGRHVDAEGREVSLKASSVSVLKANQRERRHLPILQPSVTREAPIVDPRMSVPTGDRKKRATFTFVEDQRYIRRAERFRNKMAVAEFNKQLKQMKEDRGQEAEKETLAQINLALLKKKQETVPDVEWWDTRFLANQAYDWAEGEAAPNASLRLDKVDLLVEHPVPIEPPSEAPEPPPLPMFLTRAERKKLRRRTRLERELQRQEMVARGLAPPPEPKVKISNMMRVLSADATADPTKIEQEVRRQMALRLKNHNDRNQARKKTPGEKRAKKLERLAKEVAVETTVHVYKVGDLSSKQNRFKIDVNAQYYKLHGVGLMTDDLNLVLVEGGAKSLAKFKKLVTRRIKWNAQEGEEAADDPDHSGPDQEEEAGGKGSNYCELVWEG